ncbi:MAG: DUF554 domain-containing protein [Fusobacteriaceae bacterium]|nr:DUF554 domain-containing protein [Fusobacteriaceae bacterium]
MLGTITNVCCISLGSIIGSRLKKGINEKIQNTVMQGLGLVTLSIGLTNIVSNIPKSRYPILFIISIVLGGIFGEIIDINAKIEKIGEKYKQNNFIEGLVTAVLLFCIGTLSILGPLESALKGDNTLLFTNSVLDGITSLILASTFGIGIILSAVILFIWQGSIYLLAFYISPYITQSLLSEISIIGGILLLATGLNILKIVKIKTLNFLPALSIPVIFFLLLKLL